MMLRLSLVGFTVLLSVSKPGVNGALLWVPVNLNSHPAWRWANSRNKNLYYSFWTFNDNEPHPDGGMTSKSVFPTALNLKETIFFVFFPQKGFDSASLLRSDVALLGPRPLPAHPLAPPVTHGGKPRRNDVAQNDYSLGSLWKQSQTR